MIPDVWSVHPAVFRNADMIGIYEQVLARRQIIEG